MPSPASGGDVGQAMKILSEAAEFYARDAIGGEGAPVAYRVVAQALAEARAILERAVTVDDDWVADALAWLGPAATKEEHQIMATYWQERRGEMDRLHARAKADKERIMGLEEELGALQVAYRRLRDEDFESAKQVMYREQHRAEKAEERALKMLTETRQALGLSIAARSDSPETVWRETLADIGVVRGALATATARITEMAEVGSGKPSAFIDGMFREAEARGASPYSSTHALSWFCKEVDQLRERITELEAECLHLAHSRLEAVHASEEARNLTALWQSERREMNRLNEGYAKQAEARETALMALAPHPSWLAHIVAAPVNFWWGDTGVKNWAQQWLDLLAAPAPTPERPSSADTNMARAKQNELAMLMQQRLRFEAEAREAALRDALGWCRPQHRADCAYAKWLGHAGSRTPYEKPLPDRPGCTCGLTALLAEPKE